MLQIILLTVGGVAPLYSGEVALSRVRTSIEQYRAAAGRPDSEGLSKEAMGQLKALGEAKPNSAEEAEIKLQFLLSEEVSKVVDPEILSEIVMQAYLDKLMLEF